MRIRKATKNDVEAISKLYTNLCEEERKNYDPLLGNITKSKFAKKYYESCIDKRYIIVAVDNDKIVGYLESSLDEAFYPLYNFETARLRTLYIMPEYRKQGIATKLFKQFEKYYRAIGVTHFKVTASFANASAIAFYKKVGFNNYTLGLVKY